MAEAPPKGKLGKGLGKKIGPLPLWLWLGIGAGGLLALFLYLRGRGGGDGGVGSPVELVTGNADPYQQASAGAPSPNSAPAAGLAPEVASSLGDYYPDNKLRQAAMQLVDEIRGYQEEFAGVQQPEWWSPATDSVGEAVVDATLGAPGQPAAPNATRTSSVQAASGIVKYGGQQYTTKKSLAQAMARNYAGRGNPGLAFRDWAQKHPKAAAALKGPPPPVPKKKAPQHTPKRSVPTATKKPAPAKARKPAPRKRVPARRAPVRRRVR